MKKNLLSILVCLVLSSNAYANISGATALVAASGSGSPGSQGYTTVLKPPMLINGYLICHHPQNTYCVDRNAFSKDKKYSWKNWVRKNLGISLVNVVSVQFLPSKGKALIYFNSPEVANNSNPK